MASKNNSNKSSSSSSSSKKVANKAKKQAVKYAKKHKKGTAIALAVLVIVIVLVIVVTYIVKPDFFKDNINDGTGTTQTEPSDKNDDNSDIVVGGDGTNDVTGGDNSNDNVTDNNGGNSDDSTDNSDGENGSNGDGTTDNDNTEDTSGDGNSDVTDSNDGNTSDSNNGNVSDSNNGNGGNNTDNSANGGNTSQSPSTVVDAKTEISSADLSIHFLELGVSNAGDCILIKSGNTEILIDAGAKSNSAPTSRMTEYINQYCTDGKLEYVIATHAHEDHIAGLVGQASGTTRTGILYQYEIGTIIQFANHNTTSQIYKNYVTATEYAQSKGASVYTALQCWNQTDGASRTYYLNDEKTISLNILYQKYYEEKASTENNYSVCAMISQTIDGSTYNYMFTGDLEKAGETSLAEKNNLPHCVLYKGGHHGSSTSSNDVLLSKITPDNIAICSCAGTYEYASKPDADHPDRYLNTFPTQEAIERMAVYTDKIYVTSLGIIDETTYATTGFTSMNGDIVFYYGKSEGESSASLKLWCSNNTTVLKDTEWFKANRNTPSAWA